MKDRAGKLENTLNQTLRALSRIGAEERKDLLVQETGTVRFVGQGVVRVEGLPNVRSEELLRFATGQQGVAFDLERRHTGVILLERGEGIDTGTEVRRTGRVLDAPVGEALLGRAINPLGKVLDGQGPLFTGERRAVEQPAPPIVQRSPVTVPLQTGLKAIDALIPIGRGQRQLILGDRQTGKTAIALDTIINQKGRDVICIYCSIGQRNAAVARFIHDLREYGATEHTIVVVAGGEDPPGLQYIAPYAATSMAEYFMEKGRDVLVVYDDLTRHARVYRELSLLLRRPPGREAFPGDIFYIHSRLLERATNLLPEYGGGSLTALPIIETEAQNVSAYIPTNIISITDGQIYLSPDLFQKGVLPAVDIGRSVSRVGGRTQLPAYQDIAGNLRLSYSQFVELESFARFGTRLDPETRKTLNRGYRVREALKQAQYHPLPVPEQVAVLLAVSQGILDELPLQEIDAAEEIIRGLMGEELLHLGEKIKRGESLTGEEKDELISSLQDALGDKKEEERTASGNS